MQMMSCLASSVVEVLNKPVVKEVGKLPWCDGMSAILSASRPYQNVVLGSPSSGICSYTFTIPVDSDNTTLSWAMHADKALAAQAVQKVVADPPKCLTAKIDHISAPWQTSLEFYETLSEPLRVSPRLGIFSLYQDPLLLRN